MPNAKYALDIHTKISNNSGIHNEETCQVSELNIQTEKSYEFFIIFTQIRFRTKATVPDDPDTNT